MTTHRERLEDCLALRSLDRPPVALWRHFPVDDQTAQGLAEAQLAFQRNYDFDLVKVTPASSFCLRDWGVKDAWRGSTEGTREFTQRAIDDPDDWTRLPTLDPTAGSLGKQLESLRLITEELGQATPVIQTIFNPLSQAKNLVGGQELLVHLRRYPRQVHSALQTITESTIRFIEAAKGTGIAGIFYALQHAQYGLLSREEYLDFGRRYDLQILEATRGLWLNMLHLHGLDIMFDLVRDYPVQILNWHDRETEPDLRQGQQISNSVACGGLGIDDLVFGSPEEIHQQAQEAMETTNGRRFILGTGCVVPIIAPHGNLMAARKSVEMYQ